MEDNKPHSSPTEDQSKEAKKVEAKFDSALRKLTALIGPDWSKSTKFDKEDIPEVISRIVKEKKENLFKEFQTGYIGLVEEKKKLDKVIIDKDREFKRIVLEEKKAFNKKVDNLLGLIKNMDSIEREYYDALRGSGTLEDPIEPAVQEPENQ